MPTESGMIPLQRVSAQTSKAETLHRDPDPASERPRWQVALADAVRSPRELLRRLQISPGHLPDWLDLHPSFRCLVPESYLLRIRPGDPKDPLLLQVLPLAAENIQQPGFIEDPVADHQFRSAQGVLHKYANRVLLITTGTCAIHCRYCFRREFPYNEFNTLRDFTPALSYIAKHKDITEVILSGGDPLILSDRRLSQLVKQLEGIPHVERLRIHTRVPIVLPERIDDGLFSWLGRGRLRVVMVIHANHPREFYSPAKEALEKLHDAGITMLNQAVLLAGINDNIETLRALQETGFAHGVLPYYLHQLDRTRGTGHFEVSDTNAKALFHELQSQLPGYLVPKLVREIPGQRSKTLLLP